MLPYYAARFPTVEINYTFYRMPTEKMVDGWAAATPDAFRLTLKAPKRITHDRRLQGLRRSGAGVLLGGRHARAKLGVLLFQLGPTSRRTSRSSTRSCSICRPAPAPPSSSATRRGSTTRSTSGCGTRNLALCIADTEKLSTPVVATADYGYFRLRDEGYTPDAISEWAARHPRARERVEETYVYFKHEEEGKGRSSPVLIDGASWGRAQVAPRPSPGRHFAPPNPDSSDVAPRKPHDHPFRPVPVVPIFGAPTKAQWPPCCVMRTVMCGLPVIAGIARTAPAARTDRRPP